MWLVIESFEIPLVYGSTNLTSSYYSPWPAIEYSLFFRPNFLLSWYLPFWWKHGRPVAATHCQRAWVKFFQARSCHKVSARFLVSPFSIIRLSFASLGRHPYTAGLELDTPSCTRQEWFQRPLSAKPPFATWWTFAICLLIHPSSWHESFGILLNSISDIWRCSPYMRVCIRIFRSVP